MKSPLAIVLCLVYSTALLATPSTSATRGDLALGGGGGVIPLPPPPAPANHKTPTLLLTGPLPTLITAQADARLLLVLRMANGDIVDVTRTRTDAVTMLTGPHGVPLRLDVLPRDGASAPLIGIPVAAGAPVLVRLAGHAEP